MTRTVMLLTNGCLRIIEAVSRQNVNNTPLGRLHAPTEDSPARLRGAIFKTPAVRVEENTKKSSHAPLPPQAHPTGRSTVTDKGARKREATARGGGTHSAVQGRLQNKTLITLERRAQRDVAQRSLNGFRRRPSGAHCVKCCPRQLAAGMSIMQGPRQWSRRCWP